MNSLKILAGLALASALSSTAWAQSTYLPLTDDSYINARQPGINFGLSEKMVVHSFGPKQALVRFDSVEISGLTVLHAELSIYLDSIASAGDIQVYPITSSWNELTVTWDLQPPVESVAAATVALTTSDAGSMVEIEVTDVVQRWAAGELADAGFLIVTSDGIKALFDTKEAPGGLPATLEVETGSAPIDTSAKVLDFSDPDACIIDEPGYYVLDRSWRLSPESGTPPNANCNNGVRISGNGRVTLDLRGFAIEGGDWWPNYYAVLWVDTGSAVTLRNGVLRGIFVAIEDSFGSAGDLVTLDGIRAGGAALQAAAPVAARANVA